MTRRELNDGERLDWMRLSRTERIGPITFHQLIARYGSARAALEALPELARRGGRKAALRAYPRDRAERELSALQHLGGSLLATCEPTYPEALAALEDAPPLLAVIGRTEIMARPAVGVVGARNASANGRRFAESLSSDLASAGLLVVSGLARGIDTAAHLGALSNSEQGNTAAVVAGGIDIVYPPENQPLYDRLKTEGLLLTEIPLGVQPQARHFPRRNRLISGLSRGVVVVEAAVRSGSLITARFALEQGREVFAVPGSPLDPRARGCNQLIRQGAQLIESAADVTEALEASLSPPPRPDKVQQFRETQAPAPSQTELSRARERLIELLGSAPVGVDELIRRCQFSPAIVSLALLELELAGRLERHPGNQVAMILSSPAEA